MLVRMNALADDTRLRILQLLVEETELCAQDIMTRLELSQSATSRHLRMLTAAGYLTERRREVAKCYMLNEERIEDTLDALRHFLLGRG
ncbi:MAG: ArsR family transcriptional regulator [Chloroflexi bacterium]|nr:MAG: ArsR family transcriptional regulator [Chloroflexota bacterium]